MTRLIPVKQVAARPLYHDPRTIEGNDMATVYRRGGIYWTAFTGWDGKRRVLSLGVRSLKDARLTASALEHKHSMVRLGLADPEDLDAVEQGTKPASIVLGAFLATIQSPTARAEHHRIVGAFLNEKHIQAVRELRSPETAIKLASWLAAQANGNAQQTIDKKLWAIQRFAGWCAENGYIKSHRLGGVTAPAGRAGRAVPHRAFTPSEAASLLKSTPEPYATFYAFRLWTGLRAEEALRIVRTDLELGAEPMIHVREDVSKNSLEAYLPIEPVLADRLVAAFGMTAPTTRIFERIPADDANQRRALRRHLKAAGINRAGINLRSFRMSFVTYLEASGCDLGVRMKLRRDSGRGSERLTNWTYSDWRLVQPRLRAALSDAQRWFQNQLSERRGKLA